jgi:lipoprotein-anchoring transpeptidase ErfK/SrfK
MKKIITFLILLVLLFAPVAAARSSSEYIVVNKSYHLIFVYNGQNIANVIPVCIGEGGENETPAGTYSIVSISPHPNWYFEGKVYGPYPGDTENGLGVLWMGLSLPAYGLHGTNEPFSPGWNFSHGCVRMNNSDVTKLAGMSFIGEKVEIQEGSNNAIAKHLKTIITLYNIDNFLSGAN